MDFFPGPVIDRAVGLPPEAAPLREEHRIASALLDRRIDPVADAVLPILSRGRNRVFRVTTQTGEFALKIYGPADGSAPERFRLETRALSFLAKTPLAPHVPRVIATHAGKSAALFEWITGGLPVIRNGGEIVQLQGILQHLLALSRGAAAADFPPAPSSCIRPTDLASQMEARRERVGRLEAEPRAKRLLNQFDTLWPLARAALLMPQDPARLILSPVQLGFHAALRRIDGGLVFLAFEDFGWDDPVRLVADLLWQSEMALAPEEEICIRRAALAVFGACDGGFARRFARVYPVLGLRWALQLLEAALPDQLPKRYRAEPAFWEDKKQRYLNKAVFYMERVRKQMQDDTK